MGYISYFTLDIANHTIDIENIVLFTKYYLYSPLSKLIFSLKQLRFLKFRYIITFKGGDYQWENMTTF